MIVSHSFYFNQKSICTLMFTSIVVNMSFKSPNTSMGVSSSFVMEYLKFRSTKHIH